MRILEQNMAKTLENDFKKRARGRIQEDKIDWIKEMFVNNLIKTLKAIFNSINSYSRCDLNTCRKNIEKLFFRPLKTDINIAASYIEHRKPKHHLASNDKDVIELIILHECRAV